MKQYHRSVFLIAFSLSLVAHLATALDNRQCLGNSNGTVSFDIQGIPGPEGPRGERGPKGSTGEVGVPGIQGKTGERGLMGDIGPMGNRGMTGQTGAKGQKGSHGFQGPLGPTGAPGHPGPQGIQGHPGDTVFSEEEFNRTREEIAQAIKESIINAAAEQLRHSILSEISGKIEAMNQTLNNAIEGSILGVTPISSKIGTKKQTFNYTMTVKCGIAAHNWTRIAYLDTTQGQACPPELRTFINTTTNQRACGIRTQTTTGIDSMIFKPKHTYTHICGRVRGYLYYFGGGFSTSGNIDSTYVDGVSFTMGLPRQHLWTYAVGEHEQSTTQYACPCTRPHYDTPKTPAFVGTHYYCENAFVSSYHAKTVWEDPLWDGRNCVISGNICCRRFGWFHREVSPTDDHIEVRWMRHHGSSWTEIMTDQLEIWIM